MKAYFKSFAAFRTTGSADVLSADICLDSSDGQASTVTVVGEYARSHTGQWLIYGNRLYLIDKTTPQDGRTLFTLVEPIETFSRKLLYEAPLIPVTIGSFVRDQIVSNWIQQEDRVYALPYLTVSTLDTSPFVTPDVDANGLFSLTEYIRTMRRMADLRITFTVDRDSLLCLITHGVRTPRNVVFGDGHSQLSTAAYSKSGLAKLTVIQPVDSGKLDAEGEAIMVNQSTDYYLAANGSVSSQIPGVRASGEWDTFFVGAKQDALQKATEKFAKNSASHKVEFYSDRDFQVYDPCSIKLYGEVLTSYISYKGIRSGDDRWLYKSGELATRASEKMKGVLK
ncbi:MAG: hypothetical protein IJV41_00740 [Oscillospiraceae bacterium]|nr:hypothetical protein [Oscillospiraceae bacterium]